jgi:vacuolar-type H+-ATPase subunit I/STV1
MALNNYSENWSQVLVLAKKYQSILYEFLSTNNDNILRDLKKSLKIRDDTHYALVIIQNLREEIKLNLLEELVYVTIFGNVSNAANAKAIILSVNSKKIRNQLTTYLLEIALNNKNDEDIVKDIALFLYDLKYKSELLSYINQYKDSLGASGFIENDNLEEFQNMDDFEIGCH